MKKPKPAGPTLTALQAFDDRELFGRAFSPAASWSAWRVFLKALDALPMSPEEFAVFRACTSRETAPTKPAKEAWVLAGRRSGKSRIASALAVHAAVTDWRPRLAAGEVATIMIVAADKAQAKTVFSYCKGLVETSPLIGGCIVDDKTESLAFSTGARVEVRAGDPAGLRGRSIPLFVAEECCWWPSGPEASAQDVEILRAIRPALATLGGRIIAISSPYARRGAAWAIHKKHFGRAESDVLVWTCPTTVFNPTLPAQIIADAFAEDPVAATSEWGGLFRTDLEDLLQPEALTACTIPGRDEVPPQLGGGRRYVGFLDASGGARDSYTLGIAHAEGPVVVVDAVLETRPPFDPYLVTADYCRSAKRYGIRVLTSDHFAGNWVTDAVRREGLVHQPTAPSKSELYLELAALINSRAVELPDHPRLLAQLGALERRTGRGRDAVDHRPGGSDDVANACAGAVVAASVFRVGHRRPLSIGAQTKPVCLDMPPKSIAERDKPGPTSGMPSRRF